MTKSPFPSGKLPEADTLRVATVCDLFLDHSQKHHVPDTFRWYKKYLQNFCDPYGTLLVQDLKALHVSRWLDAHPGWKGARRCAVIAIKRAFNWAEGEGLLVANPLRKVKKPPQNWGWNGDKMLYFSAANAYRGLTVEPGG